MQNNACFRGGVAELVRPLIALSISLIVFSACSGRTPPRMAELSGISPTLPVSQIPPIEVAALSEPLSYKPELTIGSVRDERDTSVLLQYEGRDITAQGDVGLVVRYLLQTAFRRRGIAIQPAAPLSLNCAVRQWTAEIDGKNVTAEAAVVMELLGPGDMVLFSGIYDGYAEGRSEKMLQNDVQMILGRAMHQALTKLVHDEQLINFISSF